jgi:arabinofuranosyltransferase
VTLVPEDTTLATRASGLDGESAAAPERPDGRKWPVQALVLALPSLLLLERAWDRRWMTDDGFINLRVVDMIQAGHGPVFNAGERVEVATSTLWLWMLTVGDVVLPLRLEWVAVVLGLACSVAGLSLATAAATGLQRRVGATGPLLPLGAAVVAVVAAVWDFSTSGLEGGLIFGWLGLCGYVLARWTRTDERPTLGWGGAAILGLGPLVRPDLLLVSLVLLAGVLLADWRTSRLGDRLRMLAAAAALPVAYEIWRMGYYAALVPNTALTKSGSRSRWPVGYAYLRDFLGPYRLWLPLLVLLAAALVPALARARAPESGQRRVIVALVALPLAGLVYGLYVVRVGGDYMHGRLLLPAFFALLVPVAAVPVPRLRGSDRRQLAVAGGLTVTAVWVLVCGLWLRPTLNPTVDPVFSSDARHGSVIAFGEHAVTLADNRLTPDDAWRRLGTASPVVLEWQPIDVTPPDDLDTPVYGGWGIGSVGYALGPDVTIVDLLGLGDPVTARFELAVAGFTGHEKPVPPPWLAAQISTAPVDPDQMPVPAIGVLLYTSPPGRFDADTAAARRALGCGDLHRLRTATRDRLTPGRFLSNLVAAPRNTLLTIPPDPHEAVDRFC